MKKLVFLAVCAALTLPAVAAGAKGASDLVAKFSVKTGTVVVKNKGGSSSVECIATVECGGGCPDPKPSDAAAYEMAAFPGKLAIRTPKLKPGASFKHTIKFYKSLEFPAGAYKFVACADAGSDVVEINERNNCASSRLKVKPNPAAAFKAK